MNGYRLRHCRLKHPHSKLPGALRIDANQQTLHFDGGPDTIIELVAHHRFKELVGENQGRKAFSTRATCEC
jgi:hypothetical protein